jgi:TldD protein
MSQDGPPSAAGIAALLLEEARKLGVYAIVREQTKRICVVSAQGGRIELLDTAHSGGVGVHVFTDRGFSAFGSSDGFDGDEARTLLQSTAEAAAGAERLGAERDRTIFDAPPLSLHLPDERTDRFDAISLDALKGDLLRAHEEIRAISGEVQVHSTVSVQAEAWRVRRSDGTDASWSVPRLVLHHAVTAEGGGGAVTVRTHLFSPDFGALSQEAAMRLHALRASGAVAKALGLRRAGHFPSGSYPLLIDYALAKGLAHEAFGHAAEADSFRSSVLARNGRFRAGERVGREGVSVVDESVPGDHAYQPISANGFRRERATIVRSGVLHEALADSFSSGPAGVRVTGAERAESYRFPPIPRMSNIRIELEGVDPLPRPFAEMTPEEVRDLAGGAGLFERFPRIVFLSGYTGGQVNPVTGDFVFNSQALYELGPGTVTLYRPGIFRGSLLAALASISRAFGPLQLDAIGTCGKWGQSVPSSGGSHGYVFLEPSPSIGVGGP